MGYNASFTPTRIKASDPAWSDGGPNGRYLCIVARQSVAAGKQDFFLPFEGDQMLSVIISKAFLLAQDAKITDPTILQQIK